MHVHRSRASLRRAAAVAASTTLVLGITAIGAASGAAADIRPAGVSDTAAPAADPAPAAGAPKVRLGAEQAVSGGQLTFAVTGYPAGAKLTVKLDKGAVVGTFTVGTAGSAAGTLTVPAGTAAGAHVLNFLAPSTSVSPGFTVVEDAPAAPVAQALVGADSYQEGAEVPFAVTGYPAGEALTVKLVAGAVKTTLGTAVTIAADGTYAGSVTVPAGTAAGAYQLFFLAKGTNPAVAVTVTAAPATTEPQVVLGASEVVAGTDARFTVTAFPAGGTLTVKLGTSKDDAVQLRQYTIGADGSLSDAVTIPATTAAGDRTLFFLATGVAVTSPLTVKAPPTELPAAATLATDSLAAGGTLGFRATGFPAGGTLTVKLDDGAVLSAFTVGADGTYEGRVTVPAATAAGRHWLRFLAKPGFSVRSTEFTVTATGTTDGGTTTGGGATGDVTGSTGSAGSTGSTGSTGSSGSTGSTTTGGTTGGSGGDGSVTGSTGTTGTHVPLASTGAGDMTLPLTLAAGLLVAGGTAYTATRRRRVTQQTG